MSNLARLFDRFAQLAQTGIEILVSFGEHLRNNLKDHTKYDQGPGIHGEPKKVLLLVNEAQLAGCLKAKIVKSASSIKN